MGKPIEQALGEVDFCRRDLRLLRRQRRDADGRRADQAARGRRLGAGAPQLLRGAARDHALELPLLPGGALRRAQPGDRQHDPAQARAAVPGVGRGDGADLPRGRLPQGRLHQHLRDQRPDRVGDRRPARARRVADRLRAGGRRGRRDRRAATSRRSCSSWAARIRSSCSAPTTSTPRSSRPSARGWRTPARPATRRSGSSSSTSSTTRSWRSSAAAAARSQAGRPDQRGRPGRPAVLDDGDRAARRPGQARGRPGRDPGGRRRARRQLLRDDDPHRHQAGQRRLPGGVLRAGGAGLPGRAARTRRSSWPTTPRSASAPT